MEEPPDRFSSSLVLAGSELDQGGCLQKHCNNESSSFDGGARLSCREVEVVKERYLNGKLSFDSPCFLLVFVRNSLGARICF